MYSELRIKKENAEQKVFLRTDILAFPHKISPLHTHHHTEIHVLAKGKLSFNIAGEDFNLVPGDVLVIPENTIHTCTYTDEDNLFINFYMDIFVEKVVVLKTNPALISEFIAEYYHCRETDDFSKFSAYISLICHDLFKTEATSAKKLSDYKFIINEFLSLHYADATLSDLAKALCLSEKQTERVVLKHTGKNFRRNITKKRIEVAKALLENNELSKKEIAEYVGYNSYGGFFKALKSEKDV